MIMSDVTICDGIRTPIGRYAGGLSSIRPDDLAALPLKALQQRNPDVDWSQIEDVVLGCANQAGEDNRNIARMALLLAASHVYTMCPLLSRNLVLSPSVGEPTREIRATRRKSKLNCNKR